MNHYNFSALPDYGNRQMFLNGRVSIQRYDDYAYPTIAKYEDTQQGAFWRPTEINLTKDQIDFKEASKAVRHIFTSNLLRQTALDSIQGRAPVQIFTPVASVPELEALVNAWSFFEVIHSRSYSHIIRNIYNVPKDEFNKIHDTKPIIDMCSSIGKYYDNLHTFNCSLETLSKMKADVKLNPAMDILLRPAISHFEANLTEYEHVKAIYLALVASYGLEAIRFMVSFATSLGMVENKLFIGNGNIISLILQDEMLHTDWTAYIINRIIKDDPRFAQVAHDCKQEAYEMLMDVIREEKQWAGYIFQEGPVIGMNEKIMCNHVDWTAQGRLKDIGMKYDAGIRSAPLPWFGKHTNTNKKQTALQENENVAYVIGSMTSTINYDDLPDI